MKQQNEMSARALSMEELEKVNGGFPSFSQILKKTRSDYEAKAI